MLHVSRQEGGAILLGLAASRKGIERLENCHSGVFAGDPEKSFCIFESVASWKGSKIAASIGARSREGCREVKERLLHMWRREDGRIFLRHVASRKGIERLENCHSGVFAGDPEKSFCIFGRVASWKGSKIAASIGARSRASM